MNLHKNARLTPKGREIPVRRMLKEGLRAEEAAQAAGVSVRTAYKWLAGIGRRGLPACRTVVRVRTAVRIAPMTDVGTPLVVSRFG